MADDSVMTLKSASGGVRSEFSYRGMKTYHVTLPAFQEQSVFADRTLIPAVLNALRDVALATHFDVILYTILPDRVVLLVHGRTDGSDMKEFLAAFRASAAAALEGVVGHRLWKRTYLERMLRRGERPERCAREIAGLAVSRGLASRPGGYEFTGSFVTDVARLVEPRRPAPPGRPEGRPEPGRGRTGRRLPPSGRPTSGSFRPTRPGRGPAGTRPFESLRSREGVRPADTKRGTGRTPGGNRPLEGRRSGFKSGRPGGRPPTSRRGKPPRR